MVLLDDINSTSSFEALGRSFCFADRVCSVETERGTRYPPKESFDLFTKPLQRSPRSGHTYIRIIKTYTDSDRQQHPHQNPMDLRPLSPRINLPLLPHPLQRPRRQHIRRRRPLHAPIPALASSSFTHNSLITSRSKPQPRRSSFVNRNTNGSARFQRPEERILVPRRRGRFGEDRRVGVAWDEGVRCAVVVGIGVGVERGGVVEALLQ